MSLPLLCCPTKQDVQELRRELWVFVDPVLPRPRINCFETGRVCCLLPLLKNHDVLVIGMSVITQAIARAELSRGGLLIHGGLISAPGHQQCGVILAGPGTVGKTTASKRLPPPWRSLSDDASFVECNRTGQILAHPWPTWSRFFCTPDGTPGQGGNWEVQSGLPLLAIFFLVQAKEDRVTPLPPTPAVAFLMETVQQVSFLMTQDLPADQTQVLLKKQLAAAETLVRTIPTFTLHLSLTGYFWDRIAETLDGVSSAAFPHPGHLPPPGPSQKPKTTASTLSLFEQNTLAVAYSGSSMNPTLRHPDLLEVIPYEDRPIRPGDVVYYQPSTGGPKVIHRVVRVTAKGIFTRGDNNCPEDPFLQQPSDVIGQVKAAWRYDKRREIAGGICGRLSVSRTRACARLYNIARVPLRWVYQSLAARGLLNSMLPASFQPRVFEFRQRSLPSILKLMVRGHVIGRYDAWKKLWEIDHPWRMVIDVSTLPVTDWSPTVDGPTLNNDGLAKSIKFDNQHL
ncbi:MAG: SynChlorMet cassette protein ScmC [Desulfobulbaceae bacterium]